MSIIGPIIRKPISSAPPGGRIAIGLAAQDTHLTQYSFQFAHEFCHALANTIQVVPSATERLDIRNEGIAMPGKNLL
jgi:hypothetical protein